MRGTWSESVMEATFKAVINYMKQRTHQRKSATDSGMCVLDEYVEMADGHMKLLDNMKQQFKVKHGM